MVQKNLGVGICVIFLCRACAMFLMWDICGVWNILVCGICATFCCRISCTLLGVYVLVFIDLCVLAYMLIVA